jgi:hypothetical protein
VFRLFQLGQIISAAVLGQVDHYMVGSLNSNFQESAKRARLKANYMVMLLTPILGKLSKTNHTRKQHFCHIVLYLPQKLSMAILRCWYGSEMVPFRRLSLVSAKCVALIYFTKIKWPCNTHSQTSICDWQIQINSSGPTLPFFPESFYGNIIGTHISILSIVNILLTELNVGPVPTVDLL